MPLDPLVERGYALSNLHQEFRNASIVSGGNRAGIASHGAEASPGVGNDADGTNAPLCSGFVKPAAAVAVVHAYVWMLSML